MYDQMLFYDIETTGFDPYKDEIVQVAYAIFNQRTFVRGDVMYLYYDGQKESPPDALKVHGLNNAILSKYKDDYKRNLSQIYVNLSGRNVAGYNNNHFDDVFINAYMVRHAGLSISFASSTDVMLKAKPLTQGRPRISLVNLCKLFNITPDMINAKCREWFGEEGQAHAAYYDVVATVLCYWEEEDRMSKIEGTMKATDISSASIDDMDSMFTEQVVKGYEPDCTFIKINGKYYPTCTDPAKYISSPCDTPPEDAVLVEGDFVQEDSNTYVYDQGYAKHVFKMNSGVNTYEFLIL